MRRSERQNRAISLNIHPRHLYPSNPEANPICSESYIDDILRTFARHNAF